MARRETVVTQDIAVGGDRDLILRDRRSYWAVVIAVVVLGGDLARTSNLPPFGWAFVGLLLVAGFVESVVYPKWIRVGSSGLTFGQWVQTTHFSCADIDHFAVGNPDRPELAYVFVRDAASTQATGIRPVQLPMLSTVPPPELVALLSDRLKAVGMAPPNNEMQRTRHG
jgi:hypothetical protein